MIVICLSTYNGAYFLKEQLQSIELQSFEVSHVLLLVRDDGSTDKSYAILQDFAQHTSLHVKLLEDRTNLGIKKSFTLLMNYALKMDAQYIMFCDQDDVWNRYKIAKTYTKMQRAEKDYPNVPLLVHSNLSVVDRDLHIIANSLWKHQNINPKKNHCHDYLVYNNVTGCSMMINRRLAEKVKKIPSEAIMHDWWIAMVASLFGKIIYIDEPLMLYRQHTSNDTGAKRYGFGYFMKQLFAKPSFEKYIQQSRTFLSIYCDELNAYQRKMLEDFSTCDRLPKWKRLQLLFKYKIWKNGFIRNLGLIFFI